MKKYSKSRPKVGDLRLLRLFPVLLVSLLIVFSFLVVRSSKKNRITLPGEENSNQGEIAYRGIVKYVIDGDTIELENGERVRYSGINTPEKDRPFFTEATEQNKKLVDGQEVRLELDVQAKDQYGRTLAYVWLEETMVNLELLRLGYANVYTVPPNVKYQDQFLAAEREARQAERGLWAKD